MSASGYLFISGMGRSGTTLVDKLLCNHRQLSVLSQPFPLLYVRAKRDFLATLGEPNSPQPLSHYFLESRYGVAELMEFLDSYWLTADLVRQLFVEMAGYDGQYHKPDDLMQRVEGVTGGRFLDIFRQLLGALRHRSDALVCGAKETHCEEFFPFLVARGVKCLAVVRDPRDVIASFNYGQGQKYGGLPRPTLFLIRNWRKSVAFLWSLRQSADFYWLRYEDLVERPDEQLAAITDWLEVEAFPAETWRRELRQQDGRIWSGNSSRAPNAAHAPGAAHAPDAAHVPGAAHAPDAAHVPGAAHDPNAAHDYRAVLNRESVGRYGRVLPESQQRFVESCCYPEMRWLGYRSDVSVSEIERYLREFQEPVPIQRQDFSADYSTRPNHLRQELERLEQCLAGKNGAWSN